MNQCITQGNVSARNINWIILWAFSPTGSRMPIYDSPFSVKKKVKWRNFLIFGMSWINAKNIHFSIWIRSLFHRRLAKVSFMPDQKQLTHTKKTLNLPTASLVKVDVVLLCRALNEWQTCKIFPVTHGLNNSGFLIACKVKKYIHKYKTAGWQVLDFSLLFRYWSTAGCQNSNNSYPFIIVIPSSKS